MNPTLLWLGGGLILVVAELLTGTFYLLVLGLACLAGAGVAFAGLGLEIQSLITAVIGVAGALWVRRHHHTHEQPRMASLDVGQSVCWEHWVSESDLLARVNYRGASWEAKVVGECSGTPGEVFHILEVHGSQLTITKAPL